MLAFTDQADFQIRFMPFQLYPELPRMDPNGVDKENYFDELSQQRDPKSSKEMVRAGFQALKGAWKMDGLTLADRKGRLGNSFDSQRLILLSRKQGCEDAMIEAIYTANHENNLCLSDINVLLDCATKAGVTGAEEMLKGNDLADEVFNKYMEYRSMGVTAVPFLMFNDKFPIHGAPDRLVVREAIKELIDKGDRAQWPPKNPLTGMTLDEFVESSINVVHNLNQKQRSDWSKVTNNLDWSNSDTRWFLLKEHVLSGGSVRAMFGEGPRLQELRDRLNRDVNPVWAAVLKGGAPTQEVAAAAVAA
mmetsp:Transcript_53863/g.101165  ORF Transcript_53863/g.101165 Transcript_53863/m.101165 type:complete len:305 (-) Transcript_53863:346-1260(-)